MGLRVTMLGSGTSTGVPMLGCRCAVCRSDDPRNRRLRAALHWQLAGGELVVDTPPDLRQQALRAGIERLDAILFTHSHADHIYGLDDVRPFNFRQGTPIPCYGAAATLAAVRRAFSYAFSSGDGEGGGKPKLELVPVEGPFEVLGETVVPVPVQHGSMEVLGFRLGRFAYVTDCNRIPPGSFELLAGVDTLILGALRYRPHATHFTVEEAIEAAARIGARRTVLTHLSHEVDHAHPAVELPPGVELGYDGLVLEV